MNLAEQTTPPLNFSLAAASKVKELIEDEGNDCLLHISEPTRPY